MILFTTMIASTMCFSVNQTVIAQDNTQVPTTALKTEVYSYSVVQEEQPEPKRWHMDLDAGYTTFSGWSVEGQGKELKGDYAVGAKLAATYSFADDMFFVGGGTGLRMYQNTWSDKSALTTKDPISKNYSIPLFVRFGVKSPFSKHVDGYIQLDGGYQFGTDNLKSAFFVEGQAGIYWDRAKIGLGIMSFNPKSTDYIKDVDNSLLDVCIGLFMGLRLF